ncbi:right-handed parallel beta-helix repeat-containing protein [Streptomyces sp. TRM 70351]|uniref:right-handed parallel beta-helix repeat-containing protein n=1 Tax=Streptomyces sp. TRM 70351 TaxID=3116552 RepID=UPI002E7C05AB|nr:right-handed parallel beta-helix repeat-containing protein [Streptomyces sp. TRM 70351]MEE1927100.1 right-handed parallel beta-helix repeat-containing protein [Streptomyces sp. TRM 70351]
MLETRRPRPRRPHRRSRYAASAAALLGLGVTVLAAPPVSAGPAATARPAATVPPGPGDTGSDTVTVTDGAGLAAALDAAAPGQTIRLADGTYRGNFKISRPGTAERRITLTGSPRAVLVTWNPGGGYGLHVNGASHWTIHGITVTGGQKGIMVDASDHVVIDAVTVHTLTMEGVHFRTSSSHGVLRNSTIRDTGTNGRGMGEGVYVGSANTLTDRSDHVRILDNVIGPRVGGENIDLKEGTTGGVVSGNTFLGDGLTGAHYDDSWVDVKGNGYLIENNRGHGTLQDGYQTHSQRPGWGCGTVFRANHSDLSGARGTGRYAFDITHHDPLTCPVTVTGDNTVTGGDGLVNPGVPVG